MTTLLAELGRTRGLFLASRHPWAVVVVLAIVVAVILVMQRRR